MPKSLTIRSFLPQREIEICQRLRAVRVAEKLEQTEFAERIGISRSRLSSYEYAKAPVRYEVGKQCCYRYGINQKWFATGQGPKGPYFDISPNLEYKIEPKALFSAAYDEVLRPDIEQRAQELKEFYGKDVVDAGDIPGEALDNFHLVGDNPAKAAAFYVRKAVLLRLQWLPPHLQIEYANAIVQADDRFMKKHGKEIAALLPPAQRENEKTEPSAKKPKLTPLQELDWEYGGKDLTEAETRPKTSAVKLQLPGLLERLQKATAEPGKKSELAKALKDALKRPVPLASVSRWLSGEREPGGEVALLMERWVCDQERK